MSGFERVIYIQGIGRKPVIQEKLPELWLPHGLLVESQPFDWTANDYKERLSEIGSRIIDLSALGNVSIVAASGGVKPMMSLLARYPKHLHRAVAINGKFEPFDLDAEPDLRVQCPNIPESSDVMQEDYEGINPITLDGIFQKLLWLYSLGDTRIPTDERPLKMQTMILPVSGHLPGIEYALTTGGPYIAGYLRDGTVPTFV